MTKSQLFSDVFDENQSSGVALKNKELKKIIFNLRNRKKYKDNLFIIKNSFYFPLHHNKNKTLKVKKI